MEDSSGCLVPAVCKEDCERVNIRLECTVFKPARGSSPRKEAVTSETRDNLLGLLLKLPWDKDLLNSLSNHQKGLQQNSE